MKASELDAAADRSNAPPASMSMHPRSMASGLRPLQQSGHSLVVPAPLRAPVLPRGWAPLTREQQEAVLCACDHAPECAVLRVGSGCDLKTEYRVYCLTDEQWAGVSIASRWTTDRDTDAGRNRELLGIGSTAVEAVQLALRFFNRDLQLDRHGWRLVVERN